MALKNYEESRERSPGFKAASTRQSKTSATTGLTATQVDVRRWRKRLSTPTLRTELLAERESRRESLEKRLFGLLGTPTPTELMVMRDSRDHAASLENAEDAQLKLKLANQAGDTFLAKAIAQAAATKGWSDIVNTYAATAPLGTRSALEELADIPSGRMTNIADAPFTIHAPSEIGAATTSVLEAIARGLA